MFNHCAIHPGKLALEGAHLHWTEELKHHAHLTLGLPAKAAKENANVSGAMVICDVDFSSLATGLKAIDVFHIVEATSVNVSS